MAAAKAARRNTFTNELRLLNDPFQDPRIGRRTGVPLNIKARRDSHGFENIDDYFPDSDPEEENVVPNAKSSGQDTLVGRRTGVPLNIKARIDSHEFENVDDYFPDSGPEEENVVPNTQSLAQDSLIGRKAVTINPTKDAEVVVSIDDDNPDSGATNLKELSPGKVQPADISERNDESPNDTGTAIKNPASREPSPQLRGQIKKRLSFTGTNGKLLNKSGNNQVHSRDLQSHKNTDPNSEEIVESEIEIDIVDLSNDSNLIVEESVNSSSLAVKSKGKDKQKHERRLQNTKSRIDEDDEFIDVEEIEEENTFLTIGNNATPTAKSNVAVDKSPASSQAENFIMSESFVLEGTRHKSMSPEFGSSSDNQTEPDPRAKKSKIPVRKKGLTNTKPVQERVTRGRKKKAAEDTQIVVTEVAEAGEKKEDKERGLPSNQEQVISTRGRKQPARKGKAVESETVEVQNRGTDEKDKRRPTYLQGKRQQQKSTRSDERKGAVSDEGDNDDESDAVNTEHGKKKPITQKPKRITRGRKQKSDTENVDEGTAEVIIVDSNGEKQSGHKRRPKQGVEDDKRTEQTGSVVGRSEQLDEGKTTEVSGRKTRAQRQQEKDFNLGRRDSKENDVDREGKGFKVVDSETEEVEIENMESLEMENEKQEYEKESTAERKGKGKKNTENDGLGNERNSAHGYSKRGGRKSESTERDNTLGEVEGHDLAKEVEDGSKVRGGLRRKGRKTQATEGKEHDAEHEEERVGLDTIENLVDGQASSNEHEKTNDASGINITNVSSNTSSGSESMTKVINGARRKRRKSSRVLPPYATKRLSSKRNNSKRSSTISSHVSMAETDAKKLRLQVEGNQTSFVKDRSSRIGATTNPRRTVRAKRPGKTPEGETKFVAQGHEKECPNRGLSVLDATVENANNDDDVIDNAASVAADEVGGDNSVHEATGAGNNSLESVRARGSHRTVTPAQPVTALKSILKSGGSAGRTVKVPRKRGLTPDKSHSGGSDADDESVLPAKQPNRKRLSTVSFASTPFVQESPSAPANRSPAGLSFVSKDSSYRSTDGTFTPGRVRTSRSSIGSAGSSSVGESSIDLEEEVTITNDATQPENEQNTRRSKRTIVPPTQYWKNERIDYERRKSGGWCIKGIIKNATPSPKRKRKPRQTKKPVVRKENNENAVDFSEDELDNQELEGFQEITNPKGMVLHTENNEEVEMDIFHTPAMLNFMNPSGKPAKDDDPLIVHKFISQPLFGGGQVVLRPEAEKGRQVVRNDTMVFYVIQGTVIVTVHQCSAVLHTGSTFFVPQGNSYNIKNLRKTDAKLMFVQIKG